VKQLFAILLTAISISASAQTQITGAGATFPYPIYSKWSELYNKETGVALNYQSIGSNGGIRQIDAKTVTFGATDAPVPGDKLDKMGQVYSFLPSLAEQFLSLIWMVFDLASCVLQVL
jgi:phosphate transport system substrate-binding protein